MNKQMKQINITYIIPNYGEMFPIGGTVNFLLKIEHQEICTNSYTLNAEVAFRYTTSSQNSELKRPVYVFKNTRRQSSTS